MVSRLGLNEEVRTQNFQGMACSSFSEALRGAAGHFAIGGKGKVLLFQSQYSTEWYLNMIRRAKKIIVANEYEHSIFLKYCNSSKLTLVKNGIDFENLQNCPFDFKMKHKIQEKLILFLGRFAEVKGIDLLLEAITQLSEVR